MSSEPTIVLEQSSPAAPAQAIVEDDGEAVYLYLALGAGPERDLRSLWIRNLGPAPKAFDVEAMKEGRAPRLPASCCAFPNGSPALDARRLTAVWFEEGTGVALYEDESLLAVIPPWATEALPGYARDCSSPSPVALPLALAPSRLGPALSSAKSFWESWEGDAGSEIQRHLLTSYQSVLGTPLKQFGPDGGKWPPKFVAQFFRENATVLVSGGACLRAQPGAAHLPAAPRRIELALALEGEVHADMLKRLASYLIAQMEIPWARLSWLGEGHTLGFDSLPPSAHVFPFVLCSTAPRGAPPIVIPRYQGDAVTLLWMLPITASERAFALKRGSDALQRRLDDAGVTFAHRERKEVGLD